MTARTDRSGHEAEIRQLIDGRLTAMHAKDANAAMASCTSDFLLFDLAPPLQHQGADVNRTDLEEWFRSGGVVQHVSGTCGLRAPRPEYHPGRRRGLLS
jgi:ketosteroid isomerase-like protein